MFGKHKISIDKNLWAKIEALATLAGYSSPTSS